MCFIFYKILVIEKNNTPFSQISINCIVNIVVVCNVFFNKNEKSSLQFFLKSHFNVLFVKLKENNYNRKFILNYNYMILGNLE